MSQIRKLLVAGAAGLGMAAGLAFAPTAAAEPSLLPQCETVGGSSVTGGQTTECATEGNAQIVSTPPVYPGEYFWGFPGFGFIP
ncbi:hypothetical protein [uncultured Mycolicibacterium sp.]|uniref:hypothetical protein n=1 Tax=uncultured Mycolicibacterium sp. TaxID=2320817 RepID=UPI0026255422|nr:hypothetical protein [uncultured Mycolicibacterium sp.]